MPALHFATEAEDPDVLSVEEAERLLQGAPWRRLVVLGDSVAAGVREPREGYRDLSWIDRIVEAMERVQPGFEHLNVARRDVFSATVRDEQVAPAVAFTPDLAIVCCGGNDALRPDFSEDAFAEVCREIAGPLQAAGADVLLSGMMNVCSSTTIPEQYREALGERLSRLNDTTRAVARELGCAFSELHSHPRGADDGLYASDRIHANACGHALAAAVTIEELGRLAQVRAG